MNRTRPTWGMLKTAKVHTNLMYSPDGGGGPIVYRGWIVAQGVGKRPSVWPVGLVDVRPSKRRTIVESPHHIP